MKVDVYILIAWYSGEGLGCRDCNKTAVYVPMVQGTPIWVLQHGSDAGSVVIISIHPPSSPSLDCFHFLF